MEFSIYGCNAGCNNELNYLIYKGNFEYQWTFQQYVEDNIDLFEMLYRLGVYLDERKLLVLESDDIFHFYMENFISTNDSVLELMDNIHRFKDVMFNEKDNFYLIVDIY